MQERVELLLERFIRPLLAVDQGDVELVAVRPDGTVVLRMLKACAGCPGVTYTLTDVITPVLRRELGQQTNVVLQRGLPLDDIRRGAKKASGL